ncbi:DUF6994 family protein [Hyphomonas johnsonii]|uniref:Uncharacterized protein n=1 Tax=Hyphomonas johnsonii MHS-2 TaxID=1280950 RepID=A0A059FS91_9PROT|nr:hypothetical protein [Hyphomonas johnsonii]KCZ93515.1 hypothetical protein HJO_06660 [Hyphomonas johnsonii MHS-2]
MAEAGRIVVQINTSFDFRTDAFGKDPDAHSATLRRYHRHLWSKSLPNGRTFALDDTTPGAYLYHRSDLGEFSLSSDSVIPSYTGYDALRHIIDLFHEEENEAFRKIGYTIGGMMVFPANRVDGKLSINGARGFNRKISDRFDLTLECIRRHYIGQTSPLADTLGRYPGFFALFDDFDGYVDFFLLQDLLSEDGSTVEFFMPFDDFNTTSVPTNEETYRDYRRRSIQFVTARNHRIHRQVNAS